MKPHTNTTSITSHSIDAMTNGCLISEYVKLMKKLSRRILERNPLININKKNKIITLNIMEWTLPHSGFINKPQNSKPSTEFNLESTSQIHGITVPTQFTITISTAYIFANSA